MVCCCEIEPLTPEEEKELERQKLAQEGRSKSSIIDTASEDEEEEDLLVSGEPVSAVENPPNALSV